MKLLNPNASYWLLVLIPVILILIRNFRSNYNEIQNFWTKQDLKNYGSKFRQIYRLASLSFILALLCFIIALINPLWGQVANREAKTKNIVFILDVSRSMLAKDTVPSRLAKSIDLIRSLANKYPNNKIAIVAFKGSAETIMPISSDRLYLEKVLQALNPDIFSSRGSDIAAGIEEGLKLIENTADTALILISDGEGKELNTDIAKSLLRNKRILFYSIGAGSKEGSKIQNKDGITIVNSQGQEVISRLNEADLRSISQESRGYYYPLSDPLLLSKLSRSLELNDGYNHQYGLRSHYQFFIFIGLLFLLLSMQIVRINFRKVTMGKIRGRK